MLGTLVLVLMVTEMKDLEKATMNQNKLSTLSWLALSFQNWKSWQRKLGIPGVGNKTKLP